MAAIAAASIALVIYGYFSWPKPPSFSAPRPPVARLDADGVPYIGYRESGDDWKLVPLAEAHDRAQQTLGYAFTLPDGLSPEFLLPAQLSILDGGPADPAAGLGTFSMVTVTYVLHPRIDSDGRVPLPQGSRVPAPQNQNVRVWLTIEHPVTEIAIPAGAEEISTERISHILIESTFVASRTGAVDTSYIWLIGDLRYRLMYDPDLRWYPREEMLAIVDATAPQ